jgi:DNA repair protein RadC
MPGDIPSKRGTEKTQQIMQKMENIDNKVCEGLIVGCAGTINFDNDSIRSKEL